MAQIDDDFEDAKGWVPTVRQETHVYAVTDDMYPDFEEKILRQRASHPKFLTLRAKSITHTRVAVGPAGVTKEYTVLFDDEV